MRHLSLKTLAGGAAVLLAVLACSVTSPTLPAAPLPTASPSPLPLVFTPTAPPATPVPTVTATPAPLAPTATPANLPFPVIASPSIQFLDMLDANTGWAMTDAAILRTTDGGSTWYNTTPFQLPGSGLPSGAFFLDAANGWVAVTGADPTTGTLFHTNDEGVTWTSAAVPFGGGSLHFTDPLHGWELVGLNAGMSHESVAIFRSDDGGATWSRAFINEPAAPGTSDSLPLVGDKNGITALDAQHAWVTGSQPSDNFIYLYMTQDGGTTWAHQDLNVPAAYNPAQTNAHLPVFFGPQDGVLPVQLFSNNNGTVFYVSKDGGQSWNATTPLAQGGQISLASALDYFVWDGAAPLQVTHDGGVTWSSVSANINVSSMMVSLRFVNATTGWVLTADASNHHMLYRTTDGGATWNVLIP